LLTIDEWAIIKLTDLLFKQWVLFSLMH